MVGVLCSRVRLEEKLIFRGLRERGVAFEKLDVRKLSFELGNAGLNGYDIVLNRCLSHSRALYSARVLEEQGVRTLSTYEVIKTCGDKIMTNMALLDHGVPTPRAAVAFDQTSALAAVERIGYPAVLKPAVGSWGRMVAKLNDREAAEAVIEHHAALGPSHAAYYIQAYIDKPGRDIRTLVIGEETVYAVYRISSHWITNTARGGTTSNLPISEEVDRLSRAAADAVGGGIVAVDLLEDADGSLLVNEVNHTPEFHGAMAATDVDVAGLMVDHIVKISREDP